MGGMRTALVVFLILCSLPLIGGQQTRLTVQVTAADTGKPIDRASVVVNFRHGLNVNMRKILTNWETKTNQLGSVSIPSMPQGEITVQVIAANFQTFGDVYQLNEPEQTISIKLNRPQPQYSEDAKPNVKP